MADEDHDLPDDITPGDSGHIADHEWLHRARNEIIDVTSKGYEASPDADEDWNDGAINAAIVEAEARQGAQVIISGPLPINQITGRPYAWITGRGWQGHSTGQPLLRHVNPWDTSMIVFTENGAGGIGPIAITDLQLKGHPDEASVANGIDTMTPAGNESRMQDGCLFARINGRTLGGSVIMIRGCGPGIVEDIVGQFCRYTIHAYDSGSLSPTLGSVQALAMKGIIAGDGNWGQATVCLENILDWNPTWIEYLKSEQRLDVDRDSDLGSINALRVINCANTVTIGSMHHIASGSSPVKPGAAINVTGAVRPTIVLGGSGIRETVTGQTGIMPYTIDDDVAGENVGRTSGAIQWGAYRQYGGAPKHLYLSGVSGVSISCPDAAGLDLTGSLDIRAHIALDDWTPSAVQVIVAKWVATGNQRSYNFAVDTTGKLRFQWTADGGSGSVQEEFSDDPVSATNGTAKWVRVTRNGATGDVAFYTSDDGSTWTQLGLTEAGSTSTIHVGTANLEIGAIGGAGTLNMLAGRIIDVAVKNGIGGSDVARWRSDTALGRIYEDPAGNRWVITGGNWRWVDPA